MKIRIIGENKAKIENALAKVNGEATDHCFTDFHHVQKVCEEFAKKLDTLLLKKDQAVAEYIAVSGQNMPSAYKWGRKVTRIKIVRYPAAYFLTSVESAEIYRHVPRPVIKLDPDQLEKSVARLMEKYNLVVDCQL